MNWLNLHVEVLDSQEFLGATPIERATWLCLQRYCIGQENGGRIEGASRWKDRKWQQVVRVTGKEVASECELWSWDGDDLVVTFYPSEKEDEVRHRREIAKSNGNRGGRPKKTNGETTKETHEKPTSVISEKAEGERKEKGKERNTPLPPEGEWSGIIPERWRNIPKIDLRNHKVSRNSALMERIGAWFGRKAATLWTLAEAIALRSITPSAEDLELLESYYLAASVGDMDYRRRDLITLLNNWSGELDRARIWTAENP